VNVRDGRVLLGVAAVAVAFAAADTYVVVLALPDMMAATRLSAEELQRAAPIISGFLLGYVAVLPLIGRVADLRGRLPVLVGSLAIFALGSLVTAAAYDLPSMVAGRLLQGVGGGGLVPATLALVADLYPPHRRGVPLGVVGAVQELGSVLGPLYGAMVLAVGDWRDIFWLNLAVGLVLMLALARLAREGGRAWRPDVVGLLVLALAVTALLLTMRQPDALLTHITWGLAFLPVAGESRWLSPVGLAAIALAVLFWLRCRFARHPLVDVRRWRGLAGEVDLLAAGLLTVTLGGIVLAFATAEPERQAVSTDAEWYLGASALAGIAFALRNRWSDHPLVPAGALRRTPAWGALVVSLLVGAALIAAIVDIPLFARLTVHPDSQLLAALVLVRFLVALPVGALLGGWLLQRVSASWITALAMALTCGGFLSMSRWGMTSLEGWGATATLVVTGLGFGLALAPVNAALLATTEHAVHGVASALLVVARMVGMLVGISVLTTLGLRRFYAEQEDLPAPFEVCGEGVSRCAELTRLVQEAGIAQLQTVFLGAAVISAAAGMLGLVLLRGAPSGRVAPSAALRGGV
jgi:predicted MFS family arabinose efflux permease